MRRTVCNDFHGVHCEATRDGAVEVEEEEEDGGEAGADGEEADE